MKHRIVFALIMGILTTGIISFAVLSVNIGFVEHFLKIWFTSWALAYAVVIPCLLLIGPQVEKLVKKILKENVEERP